MQKIELLALLANNALLIVVVMNIIDEATWHKRHAFL